MQSDWDANFKKLVAYHREFGHIQDLKGSDKTHPHGLLGNWIESLRYTKHREDKKRLQEQLENESGVVKKKARRGYFYLTAERIQVRVATGYRALLNHLIYVVLIIFHLQRISALGLSWDGLGREDESEAT